MTDCSARRRGGSYIKLSRNGAGTCVANVRSRSVICEAIAMKKGAGIVDKCV
jgi:hypothetical protein